MKLCAAVAFLSLGLLAGCDKVETAAKAQVAEVEEAAKAQVAEFVFKGCSDPSTIATLKGIFDDQYVERVSHSGDNKQYLESVRAESDLQVLAIRTDSIDKDVGKHDCRATMRIELPESHRAMLDPKYSMLLPESSVALTATGMETAISYTAQMTDDGQNVYVEAAQPFELPERLWRLSLSFLSFDEAMSILGKRPDSAQLVPNSVGAEDCFEAKTKAYRLENGEGALVSDELVSSWKKTCSGENPVEGDFF